MSPVASNEAERATSEVRTAFRITMIDEREGNFNLIHSYRE